jgi:hypothetical protein
MNIKGKQIADAPDGISTAKINANAVTAAKCTLTAGAWDWVGLAPSSDTAPSAGNDLCNKTYVDSIATGLSWHASCVVRAQGNINLSAPGSTIDGISMSVDDRVLCDQQTTTTQDGIYLWKGAAVAMVRSADAQTGAEFAGAACFIEEGTDADTGFVCTNDDGSDVVGTDDLVFVPFTGVEAVTYETAGNITDVDAGDTAAAGTRDTTARGDHEHGVSTGTPGAIEADDSAVEGTSTDLARADHQHSIVCATAGAIAPDDSAAEGSATSFARSDHTHSNVCAAPDEAAQLAAAAAEGDATSFSRSDHVHKANTAASGLAGSGTIGTSQDIARADHQHARDTSTEETITTEAITGTDTALTDTLDNTPVSNGSLALWLNGVFQDQGAGKDYTVSGTTITWLASSGTAVDMETDDVLTAKYLY